MLVWRGHSCPLPLTLILILISQVPRTDPGNPVEERRFSRRVKP
jgi:hypothetical protein